MYNTSSIVKFYIQYKSSYKIIFTTIQIKISQLIDKCLHKENFIDTNLTKPQLKLCYQTSSIF